MKRNPLIPFAVIAAFGILFMLVIGIWGGHAAQERAASKEKGATAAVAPDKLFEQNCSSCHGKNLEGGGSAPNLQHIGKQMSKDAILKQINNGGGGMPGGLIKGDDAVKVAEWLAKKK
ncbi:MAG: c-type cytochrome [Tuberibacillus sp.]